MRIMKVQYIMFYLLAALSSPLRYLSITEPAVAAVKSHDKDGGTRFFHSPK